MAEGNDLGPPIRQLDVTGAGSIQLFADRVKFVRQGAVWALSPKRGITEVDLQQITAVNVRRMPFGGIFHVALAGNLPPRNKAQAQRDPYSVKFPPGWADRMEQLREAIDEQRRRVQSKQAGGAAAAVEALAGLARLRDSGVIDEDEFAKKRQSLLDQIG